jgi:hypothetical protein
MKPNPGLLVAIAAAFLAAATCAEALHHVCRKV